MCFSFLTRIYRTKRLIEDYHEEVASQIRLISNGDFDGLTTTQKNEFISDTRQSFGNTALLLQGGASFGKVYIFKVLGTIV
jgi:TAG lipase/lysophosphatidylethanolamine acyltransferase